MGKDPGFDRREAHRYFSTDCFNKAWELIEKPTRTPEEDEQMIRLSQTSLWHWTQRDDCQTANLAIGYWQASRIYAILGRSEDAKLYGRLCLEHSRHESAFLLGYAYEAMARAERAAGNSVKAQEYFDEALRVADGVSDVDDRKLLLNDLRTVNPLSPRGDANP